ncbi:MAG: hypothetical protein LBB93_05565 [Elusimicrobiota bacterium]|jgi:phosphopantothenoylcysteine synthetase/decarboxylase|nr:hypothetical protein [Elusimicrobiota bacterium]
MSKLNFLVLSGSTREYIDPVRFISNKSSGKMGKALAEQIVKRKNNLIFITGPAEFMPSFKLSCGNQIIKVTSADEMFAATKKNLKQADIIISVAAVCDFKALRQKKNKIKKTSTNRFSIELTKNPDIVAYCARKKKNQVVVGFALETQNIFQNAEEKLEKKNLDLIVANSDKSFGADFTTAYIIRKNAKIVGLKNFSKKEIARRIINESISLFRNIKDGKNNPARI